MVPLLSAVQHAAPRGGHYGTDQEGQNLRLFEEAPKLGLSLSATVAPIDPALDTCAFLYHKAV
jgi:hypothetical protein